MSTVIKTTVYTLSELIATFGEDSKPVEKAYEWGWRYAYELWNGNDIIADVKEIASLMGIDIDIVGYSGFSSQDDGACFEGRYQYKKGSVKAVKEYAPEDKELHRIAEFLADIQKHQFYGVRARVKHTGRYYHEHCTTFDIFHESDRYEGDKNMGTTEDDLKETLKDYMRWIYKRLKDDYDYCTSKEYIKEMIKAKGYTFTAEGKRF